MFRSKINNESKNRLMTKPITTFDNCDEFNARNQNQEPEFDDILARRSFLKGTISFGASAFVLAAGLPTGSTLASTRSGLTFKAVTANSDDNITIPEGFNAQVLVRWADPLHSDTPGFNQETFGSAATQALAVGDNNDGMDTFTVDGRTVLVFNNEFTNIQTMFSNRLTQSPETDDDVNKGKAAHGLTIVELKETNEGWHVVKDSPLNRRITPDTEFFAVGPAAGSDLLKTTRDQSGTKILGTFNNCGNGKTPWGTYLACEENINGYFSSSLGEEFHQSIQEERYGIAKHGKDWGYKWAQTDARFDVSTEPHEPNRHGWVVEIDPSGQHTPRKLTALGRLKHENAELVIAVNGHVVVYLGDDERGEFLYRFVSRDQYHPNKDNAELLHDGELFAAKFHDDGTGEWISLKEAGMPDDEALIFARLAASKVGATTMDRPEWVAVNPSKAEAYVSLTNNKYRGDKASQPLNMANPRKKNPYGHILRWTPQNENHAARTFTWDIFLLAGNPTQHTNLFGGSSNINTDNMFNSPDGLRFDAQGNLWIQTDGDYSNKNDFAGMGNNQMLMGNPETGEIHRFLVGPRECEITGLTWSLDQKTMFVGIQHPGQKGGSHWPDGGNATPRSAIIAIKRDDGGVMG
jgi:secreted PhoX family phosphatase